MRLSGIGQAVEHPVLGPVVVTGMRELGGWPDNQVAQTVDLMRERVREDRGDAGFRGHAQTVTGGLSGVGACEAAWAHVKGVIAFYRDEELGGGLNGVVGQDVADDTIEFIIRPREMAKLIAEGRAAGDCDDFSMYLAAILEAQGIPCSFITVAADGKAPDQYSHVYVRAYPTDAPEGMALDASHGGYPGWEVPNVYGKWREWPVEGDGVMGLLKNLLVISGGVAGAWYLYKEFAQ
jgi:hypothetical protein